MNRFNCTVALLLTAITMAGCDTYYKAEARAHGVSPSSFHDMRRQEMDVPCDFLAAPIGRKGCHYEDSEEVYWHVMYRGQEFEEALKESRVGWARPDVVSPEKLCPQMDGCTFGFWYPVEKPTTRRRGADLVPFPAEVWLHARKVKD